MHNRAPAQPLLGSCTAQASPALLTPDAPACPAAPAAGKYRTAAVSDEGDVYMWEGRSDYFPAEGRQPGSGSKKPSGGSATRARPIPGRGGTGGMRIALGGGEPVGTLPGGSYGSADVHGGSYGSHSHSRRAGSWMERFGRERETAAAAAAASSAGGWPSSYGAGGGAGSAEAAGMLSGGLVGSAAKGGSSRMGDTFERIRPQRCAC